MNKKSIAITSIMAILFSNIALSDDFYEERITCSESGAATIYEPEDFNDMSSGGVIPVSESLNGSIVSFAKDEEPFLIRGELYHYVDAAMFPSLDGQTTRFTQGLMRVSDMSRLDECRW